MSSDQTTGAERLLAPCSRPIRVSCGRAATAIVPILAIAAPGLGACGPTEAPVRAEPITRTAAGPVVSDSVVLSLMREFDVPSVIVAWVEDGKERIVGAWGEAGPDGAPATVRTLYNLASVSKLVTAWGVLRLVDEGLVQMDAPMNASLSRWRIAPGAGDPDGVTARRLLVHRGGLSVPGFVGFRGDSALPSLEDVLNGIPGQRDPVRLIGEPGGATAYSGGGYGVLQLLVEETAGTSFAAYMEREVLRPLGMADAAFRDPLDPAISSRTATPADWRGRWLRPERFRLVAAAGLYGSARDLAALLDAELAGHRARALLSDSARALLHRPVAGGPWAAGHLVRTVGDKTIIGHVGINTGFRGTLQIAPEAASGIAVFTNSDSGDYVYAELVCRWARATLDVTVEECDVAPRERRERHIIRRLLAVGFGSVAALLALVLFGVRRRRS